MEDPRTPQTPIYLTIIGVSALLIFAFMLTGSFWLTTTVMVLGCLHIARHFPSANALVENDIALKWLRRFSPLIVVGIFLFMLATRFVR
jgi:hypothetical protein